MSDCCCLVNSVLNKNFDEQGHGLMSVPNLSVVLEGTGTVVYIVCALFFFI